MEALIGFTGLLVGWLITYIKFKTDRKDRFRMVAIQKRLETHQKAFYHWNQLVQVIHGDGEPRMDTVKNAREFWIKNCLYLEKETRKRFDETIGLVDFYHERLLMAKETEDKNEKKQLVQDYLNDWDKIMKLPNFIFSEVDLEPIVLKLELDAEGLKRN